MSSTLTIQFPEDFDKRYGKYRTGLLGNDVTHSNEIQFSSQYNIGWSSKSFNFEDEKKRVKFIASADDHKLAKERWLNIKQILDAIYKVLSPLIANDTQEVSLNPNTLSLEQKAVFSSVLRDMLNAGDPDPVI